METNGFGEQPDRHDGFVMARFGFAGGEHGAAVHAGQVSVAGQQLGVGVAVALAVAVHTVARVARGRGSVNQHLWGHPWG